MATCDVVARAAHDFRKVIDHIKNNPLITGKSFEIVQDEAGKETHAEMRIVDYLLSNKKLTGNADRQIYIGISKACCLDCSHSIKSLNKVLAQQNKENLPAEAEYDLAVIAGDEKIVNKHKNQGKLIIKSASEEIFDYHAGKFVKWSSNKTQFIAQLCQNGSASYSDLQKNGIDLKQYNGLTHSLGCNRKAIIYGDVSSRETHGISYNEKWKDHMPKFLTSLSLHGKFFAEYNKIKIKYDQDHEKDPKQKCHNPLAPAHVSIIFWMNLNHRNQK